MPTGSAFPGTPSGTPVSSPYIALRVPQTDRLLSSNSRLPSLILLRALLSLPCPVVAPSLTHPGA